MIDVPAGILPGAGPAMSVGTEWAAGGGSPRKGTGHLFMALDIKAFADPGAPPNPPSCRLGSGSGSGSEAVRTKRRLWGGVQSGSRRTWTCTCVR